jgi:hypothetical protein
MNGLVDLELSLVTIELKHQYSELDDACQKAFITYVSNELNAMDDEFSSIISYLLNALRSNKDIEIEVDKINHKSLNTNILLVVQSILDYLIQFQND